MKFVGLNSLDDQQYPKFPASGCHNKTFISYGKGRPQFHNSFHDTSFPSTVEIDAYDEGIFCILNNVFNENDVKRATI